MNTINKLLVSVSIILTTVGCSDFLDKAPDNRTEITSASQIAELLVDGYSTANYSMICELSSDNTTDNNAPIASGFHYNLNSFEPSNDEAFAWEDIVSGDDTDSPSYVWEGYYKAIAVANHALQAISRFEAQGLGNEVSASKGEALIIRAYHHFVLVNIFAQAYKDENLSKNDLGIPYISEVKEIVYVNDERLSVAEVYKRIEEDLLAGLDLVTDNYSILRYHFNRQAANAFAARFYLYKREYDKVVKYANEALGVGGSAASQLRNWGGFEGKSSSESRRNEWMSTEQFNNFLLIPTYSRFSRVCGTRYGCSGDAGKGTIYGEGPTWNSFNFHPCYQACGLYYRSNSEYGYFLPKLIEYFEYTDKIAGIGFAHLIRAEFTAEETLLCRAEAKVYLKDYTGALEDLRMWDDSRKTAPISDEHLVKLKNLTFDIIQKFYTSNNTLFVKELNNSLMSPSFVISEPDVQLPYIYCVLHFRRLETIFDGLRWFDIKRYGIEIEHKIGINRVEKLTWDDPRRALQIPADVIASGMIGNDRTPKAASDSKEIHTVKLELKK